MELFDLRAAAEEEGDLVSEQESKMPPKFNRAEAGAKHFPYGLECNLQRGFHDHISK